ncbi:MAG: hypothetical protein AAF672_12395, partial [Pseudomonadota bacterium]
AAMHRLGLTVSQIAALVLAFLRVRVEAAAALPLVRREDIKLLWAVPVFAVLGLTGLALQGGPESGNTSAGTEAQPVETQLVSARLAPTDRASVRSAGRDAYVTMPRSAAGLGITAVGLYGSATLKAPTLSTGPALQFRAPAPHLAAMSAPAQLGALAPEPVSPAPGSAAETIVRSGESEERPLRIFVPNGMDPVARAETLGVVARALTPFISSRDVAFEISQSHIRVYHRSDLPEARRMAEALGVLLRDMTAHQPKPPAGLIEVYIAGLPAGAEASDQASLEPAAEPVPSQSLVTRAAIDDVLQELAPEPEPPVAVQPAETRIIRPVVIETPHSASRRGLLERLFQLE